MEVKTHPVGGEEEKPASYYSDKEGGVRGVGVQNKVAAGPGGLTSSGQGQQEVERIAAITAALLR